MKHHHSRRESPAGCRAQYVLRPVEVAPGVEAGGRKAVALLWIDQSKSRARRHLERFCARHGLQRAVVQSLGALVAFEVTGHWRAVQELCRSRIVERWEPLVRASVQEVSLEDFSGERSVRLAQPPKKPPLPPLPGWNGLSRV